LRQCRRSLPSVLLLARSAPQGCLGGDRPCWLIPRDCLDGVRAGRPFTALRLGVT